MSTIFDRRRFTNSLSNLPIIPSKDKTTIDDRPIDPREILLRMMNEQSPAVERYNRFLEEQPSAEDYKPSKTRRFLAALAGAGVGYADPNMGFQISSGIVNDPLDRALGDWERRRIPLQNAARAESESRTTKMNALKEYIQNERTAKLDESLIKDREERDKDRDEARVLAAKEKERARLDRIQENASRALERAEDNFRLNQAQANLETERAKDREFREKDFKATQDYRNRQLGLSERRLSAYESSIEGLNNYRNHLRTKVKADGKPTKATRELAEINVYMKPGNSQRYDDFFERLPNGKILVKPPEQGRLESEADFSARLAEYTGLIDEIQREEATIIGPRSAPKPSETPKPEERRSRVIRRESR